MITLLYRFRFSAFVAAALLAAGFLVAPGFFFFAFIAFWVGMVFALQGAGFASTSADGAVHALEVAPTTFEMFEDDTRFFADPDSAFRRLSGLPSLPR